jgi:hypothetical protein
MQDLEQIQSNIHGHHAETVRKWTSRQCGDSQIPLIVIVTFLTKAVPPFSRAQFRIDERPECQAALDIIQRSNLSTLLEYDTNTHCIQYRENVPPQIKSTVAQYLFDRSTVVE